jgi:hypothetical protein
MTSPSQHRDAHPITDRPVLGHLAACPVCGERAPVLPDFTLGDHSPLHDGGTEYFEDAVDIGDCYGLYCPGPSPEFVFTCVLGASDLDIRDTSWLRDHRDGWNIDPGNVIRRRHYVHLQQWAGVFTLPELPKPAKRDYDGQERWLMTILGIGAFLPAQVLADCAGLSVSTIRHRLRSLREQGLVESDWRGHAALVIN